MELSSGVGSDERELFRLFLGSLGGGVVACAAAPEGVGFVARLVLVGGRWYPVGLPAVVVSTGRAPADDHACLHSARRASFGDLLGVGHAAVDVPGVAFGGGLLGVRLETVSHGVRLLTRRRGGGVPGV